MQGVQKASLTTQTFWAAKMIARGGSMPIVWAWTMTNMLFYRRETIGSAIDLTASLSKPRPGNKSTNYEINFAIILISPLLKPVTISLYTQRCQSETAIRDLSGG